MRTSAIVIGAAEGPGAMLFNLAQGLGFDSVMPYGGIEAAEQLHERVPVLFFLCATVHDARWLQPATEAVRSSRFGMLRFSPLIYFADSPSLETIKTCIHMGFDDVIVLPQPTRRVADRVFRQLDRALVYYETSNYFGPDRRGRTGDDTEIRDGGVGPSRRIEIIRTKVGIGVIKDDIEVVV